MAGLHRTNDAVITVCQNNPKQSIEILALNGPAERLTGILHTDSIGRPLVGLLGAKTRKLLEEYVEFKENGKDLAEVLDKQSEIEIYTQAEKKQTVGIKILRKCSVNAHAQFDLILQPAAQTRRDEAARGIRSENLKGHEVLDPHSGLPDKATLMRDIATVRNHVASIALAACYTTIGIDHFSELVQRHGTQSGLQMLRHVATVCRQRLRIDDVVGRVAPDMLGVLLMDIQPRSARIVLNRLRWSIASQPFKLEDGSSPRLTASIAYTQILSSSKEDLVDEAAQYLQDVRGTGRNIIIEMAF